MFLYGGLVLSLEVGGYVWKLSVAYETMEPRFSSHLLGEGNDLI